MTTRTKQSDDMGDISKLFMKGGSENADFLPELLPLFRKVSSVASIKDFSDHWLRTVSIHKAEDDGVGVGVDGPTRHIDAFKALKAVAHVVKLFRERGERRRTREDTKHLKTTANVVRLVQKVGNSQTRESTKHLKPFVNVVRLVQRLQKSKEAGSADDVGEQPQPSIVVPSTNTPDDDTMEGISLDGYEDFWSTIREASFSGLMPQLSGLDPVDCSAGPARRSELAQGAGGLAEMGGGNGRGKHRLKAVATAVRLAIRKKKAPRRQRRGEHMAKRPTEAANARDGQKHWAKEEERIRRVWEQRGMGRDAEWGAQMAFCSEHVRNQGRCLLMQLQMAREDRELRADAFLQQRDDAHSFCGWTGFQVTDAAALDARLGEMLGQGKSVGSMNKLLRNVGLQPSNSKWQEAWSGLCAFEYKTRPKHTHKKK